MRTRIRYVFSFMLMISLATSLAWADQPERSALETYNLAAHGLNNKLDRWLLKPAAKGYKAVTPDLIEKGVSNFFSNLGEFVNIPNDLLQGKFKQASNDTGRLLVNSTLGVGGLFDVADNLGIKKADGEDLGQTLGVWGVPSGPYLVIPLLGPSTLRDFPSRIVDSLAFNPVNKVDDRAFRLGLIAMDAIDTRAGLLKVEQLVMGDEYSFIKSVYLQRREYLVEDGNVEDDFSGGEGDFLDEESYDEDF